MNDQTIAAIRTLKDNNGAFMWQPALTQGEPDRLLGYAHHIRKIHPTPKPPQLMKEIIEFFSKENELVFDYFMGVGGTLLGAGLCGRRAIGIDLEKKYIDAYKVAATEINVPIFECIEGDCMEIMSDDNKILDKAFSQRRKKKSCTVCLHIA